MKQMRYIFALFFLLGLWQGAAAQSALPIQVDLDHATFAYDADQSLVEVYMAFGANSLQYTSVEEGFLARLPLDLSVQRSTDATLEGTPEDAVWQDTLTLSFVLPDTTGLLPGQYFVHQLRVPVRPGEYELHVTVPEDPAMGRSRLRLQRDILVPDFSQSQLVGLSDITLATTINQSEERDNPFFKNGLVIRPNANQLYGEGLNRLFYYAEAYNTDAVVEDDEKYTLLAYIAEANRPQPLPGLERRNERDPRSPDVLVGTFNLKSLPSGSYFLRLAVLDDENQALAEQSRKFFIFNPSVQREEPVALEASFETSEYATMSEEEVDKSFEHVAVIATDRDKRRMRSIQDLDERRRFLMDFWRARDPNPTTPVNEFKDEYYSRLQYANERYSSSLTEGWKSDRGRTLIKYGPPAQIEPHLYDRESLPYEIWQYNNIPGEGQAIFIFADRNSFGEFELLHSTVSGEPKMSNWQQELVR